MHDLMLAATFVSMVLAPCVTLFRNNEDVEEC
jgi:hypothetical protein